MIPVIASSYYRKYAVPFLLGHPVYPFDGDLAFAPERIIPLVLSATTKSYSENYKRVSGSSKVSIRVGLGLVLG